MKRTHKTYNGFSLIEIVIAISVLFVGIIGIFSLFPASYRMADLSKITTRMTLVGHSKIDELTALGFNNLPVGTHAITDADLQHLIANPAVRNKFLTSTVTIRTIGQNPLNNSSVLKRIDVNVRYAMKSNKYKTEIFSTYISNPLHG
ncbi:MAG: prepilin-type N-terminal cleavage/methylation domain-containing protein [Candidatus Omnitrophica bacterium]|nr:prepilin-type N-terminal cleavage/methylation domain-containing protein [Candidatus Omnitrophota bacterium]